MGHSLPVAAWSEVLSNDSAIKFYLHSAQVWGDTTVSTFSIRIKVRTFNPDLRCDAPGTATRRGGVQPVERAGEDFRLSAYSVAEN